MDVRNPNAENQQAGKASVYAGEMVSAEGIESA